MNTIGNLKTEKQHKYDSVNTKPTQVSIWHFVFFLLNDISILMN